MTNKGCELCSNTAAMFCDSDQASLCWDCDEKVHAANFLVAKHSRTLLCHVCHSPTPWTAAGPNLGRTVSVCHACTLRGDEDYQESESDDGEYDTEIDDFSEEEEEEEGENQVVPWSDSASDSPPSLPAAAAASSSDREENVDFYSLKRNRDESEDENGGCDSPSDESDSSSVRLLRPLKNRRRSGGSPGEEEQCFSGTAAIVERLRRFESVEGDASEIILGLCKLTGD